MNKVDSLENDVKHQKTKNDKLKQKIKDLESDNNSLNANYNKLKADYNGLFDEAKQLLDEEYIQLWLKTHEFSICRISKSLSLRYSFHF